MTSELLDERRSQLMARAAAEASGDAAALESFLADDFTGVGPLGFTQAAVVTACQRTKGAYQGQEVPTELRATLVPINIAGTWRLVGIHMSFIAGTPGAPPIPGRP